MKITLSDGTVIDNLTLNGNCYVSQTEVDESGFTDNMTFTVTDDNENNETFKNMKFLNQLCIDGAYYLSFYQKSAEELEKEERAKEIEALWESMDFLLLNMQ